MAYVCMYVCMYVRMYVYVYVWVYVRMCVYIYVYRCVRGVIKNCGECCCRVRSNGKTGTFNTGSGTSNLSNSV